MRRSLLSTLQGVPQHTHRLQGIPKSKGVTSYRPRFPTHHCPARPFTDLADADDAVERDAMHYDVVCVGGGPSGLAAAIRIKQLALEREVDLSVCVVEKGGELGAHVLSGNVFEPRALDELFPDWREMGAPVETEVTEDKFLFLTEVWLG